MSETIADEGATDLVIQLERVEAERDALREKCRAQPPVAYERGFEDGRWGATKLSEELIEAARTAIIFAVSSRDFLDSKKTTAYSEAFEALGALLPTHPKENP